MSDNRGKGKGDKGVIGRRPMLAALGGALAALAPVSSALAQFPLPLNLRARPPVSGAEVPEEPDFYFAQLKIGDGFSWNPYPTAARTMMETLMARTSIPAAMDRVDLRPDDPKLFHYPFLCWTGSAGFDPLPEAWIERLRLFLEMGGFMLVDDAQATPGVGFDKSFRRELARLFPGEELARLDRDHTVYKSYYLLDRVAGRTTTKNYLSGINRDDRAILIHSPNDLGGAWERDGSGRFMNTPEPGGEAQRELAFRTGVNIIMYALCVNYKSDLIHVPFISERRKGRR